MSWSNKHQTSWAVHNLMISKWNLSDFSSGPAWPKLGLNLNTCYLLIFELRLSWRTHPALREHASKWMRTKNSQGACRKKKTWLLGTVKVSWRVGAFCDSDRCFKVSTTTFYVSLTQLTQLFQILVEGVSQQAQDDAALAAALQQVESSGVRGSNNNFGSGMYGGGGLGGGHPGYNRPPQPPQQRTTMGAPRTWICLDL